MLESVPWKTTALVLALIVLGMLVRVPISQGGEKYEANKKEVKKGSRAQQGRVLLDSDSNEQKAKGMTKSDLVEGVAAERKATRAPLTPKQSKAIKDIGVMIELGRPLKEVKGRWEALIKGLAKGKASIDVDALVQQVMQKARAQQAHLDSEIAVLEDKLQGAGDDAQLANIDLQNMLQEQQRLIQVMSNMAKTLHDTAMSVIRNMRS